MKQIQVGNDNNEPRVLWCLIHRLYRISEDLLRGRSARFATPKHQGHCNKEGERVLFIGSMGLVSLSTFIIFQQNQPNDTKCK